MTSQNGRDFLLKIGDGGTPETFTTLGSARTVALVINNAPVDATTMDAGGVQSMAADAGVQSLQISIDGLFKNRAVEETLRAAAFARIVTNFQLLFPNGDMLAGAFVIQNYHRGGTYDGLESFSATLIRSGASTFTP